MFFFRSDGVRPVVIYSEQDVKKVHEHDSDMWREHKETSLFDDYVHLDHECYNLLKEK